MNGYTGQTVWVDLTQQTVSVKATDREMVKNVVGGRGLGIRLLTELAPAGVDPLAPENPIILATGPYTGAGVFSAFFNVTTKSPADRHRGGQPLRRQVGPEA